MTARAATFSGAGSPIATRLHRHLHQFETEKLILGSSLGHQACQRHETPEPYSRAFLLAPKEINVSTKALFLAPCHYLEYEFFVLAD